MTSDRKREHKIGAGYNILHAAIDIIQMLLNLILAMQLLDDLKLLFKLRIGRVPSIQHRHVHLIHCLKIPTCSVTMV